MRPTGEKPKKEPVERISEERVVVVEEVGSLVASGHEISERRHFPDRVQRVDDGKGTASAGRNRSRTPPNASRRNQDGKSQVSWVFSRMASRCSKGT